MPIFDVDFSAVQANIPIHEKGQYQLKITRATPKIFAKKDDFGMPTGEHSAGVEYGFELAGKFDDETNELITEGYEGKQVESQIMWIHSEGALRMTKRFIMAASGFNPATQEEEFDAQLEPGAFGFEGEVEDDSDAIQLGSAWTSVVGNYVNARLSKTLNSRRNPPQEEQDIMGFTPAN